MTSIRSRALLATGSTLLLISFFSTACQKQPTAEQARSEQLTAEVIDMIRHHRPSDGQSVWELAAAKLEEAVSLDSTNALAHASLSLPYIMQPGTGTLAFEEAKQKSRAGALKALELDSNLADAHVADAITLQVYENDFDNAQIALERAIELDPNHSEARREYAIWHTRTGNLERALVEFEKGLSIDSLHIQLHDSYCDALRLLGRLDEAETAGKKAMTLDVNSGAGCLIQLHQARGEYESVIAIADNRLSVEPSNQNMKFNKGIALAGMGKYDEAMNIVKEFENPAVLAWINALAGNVDEAMVYIAKQEELIEEGQWGWNRGIALSLLTLGKNDEAIARFEAYYDASEGFTEARMDLKWWLQEDVVSAPIRDDVRIQALLKRNL